MGERSGAYRTSGCCEGGGVGDDGLRNMGRMRRAKGASNADMVWSHGLSRIESSVIIIIRAKCAQRPTRIKGVIWHFGVMCLQRV